MEIPIYQVDAFTEQVFNGNPAAVCPLKQWIDPVLMQKIAQENNLSETAFLFRTVMYSTFAGLLLKKKLIWRVILPWQVHG